MDGNNTLVESTTINAQPTPQTVKVSTVIAMLASGKDRKTIAKELGLTPHNRKVLFAHPSLKGRKTVRDEKRVSPILIIEDDAPIKKASTASAAATNEESNDSFAQ